MSQTGAVSLPAFLSDQSQEADVGRDAGLLVDVFYVAVDGVVGDSATLGGFRVGQTLSQGAGYRCFHAREPETLPQSGRERGGREGLGFPL